MELKDILSTDDKLRIIQELVPGKQITLAHVIASPDPILPKSTHVERSV